MKLLHVVLKREVDWLRGEVADDDYGRISQRCPLWLAYPGKYILIVVIEHDAGGRTESPIAMVERNKLAVPA